MRKKILLLLFAGLLFFFPELSARQQTNIPNLASYFDEAYARYPNIPAGILEATAYAASHMVNLGHQHENASCTGMPERYGLFGLVEDGQGYFRNNLLEVSARSNITPAQFKKDVRLQILAVAKFLSEEASNKQLSGRTSQEDFSSVLELLTEIPDDGSELNTYARSLFTYEIFNSLQRGFSTPSLRKAPLPIDLQKIYPGKTLQRLQAPSLKIDVHSGQIFAPSNATSKASRLPDVNAAAHSADRLPNNPGPVAGGTNVGILSADYGPAIWNPAATCNYGNGRSAAITHVGIHTTEGSYAGTISWFKNCNRPNGNTSAHYVIRSSDGQVTQMVAESNTAWHIGNHNHYTIGIEHEAVALDPSWFTEALYQSSASLTRDICASYGIDPNTCFRGPGKSVTDPQPNSYHVKGHQHYQISNGKYDPGPHFNWPKYADLLKPFVLISDGTYRITNVGSGKVLNGRGCSGNNSTIMEQWDWTGEDCQRWLFQHVGDGWYRISSRISGRALDVASCQPGDGVTVQLWDWLNNDCQRWRIQDWGNGQIRLVNKASGKLLDVNNGSTANGVQVWQWSMNGTNAQRWTLTKVSPNYIANGTYRIRLGRNNKVMQPADGNIARGSAMVQWDWLDTSYQKWQIEATPDGWYKFTAAGGAVLDLNICNLDDGGKVMLWDWLDNDCQRWAFEGMGNGLWAIISKASGKVLDGPDPDNGGRVYQWQWLNNGNQLWYVDPVSASSQLLMTRSNSIGKEIKSSAQFSFAPNPVSIGKDLRLEYRLDAASQPATIILTDIYGRQVQQQKVVIQHGYNLFRLNTRSLTPGMYVATILADNNAKKESKKILVVH